MAARKEAAGEGGGGVAAVEKGRAVAAMDRAAREGWAGVAMVALLAVLAV